MRNLTRHVTYANVVASLALFLALGGTAFAAIVITGKNVKDSTLTGADVRNGTLSAVDLSTSARASFKGAKGDTGAAGTRGLTGETGSKGDTGAPGAPAEIVTSYASRNTGFITSLEDDSPNDADVPWWDYNCGNSGTPDGADCAGDNGNQRSSGVANVALDARDQLVLALQGMGTPSTNERMTSNNAIVVPWSSNLTGMASVSLLHRGDTSGTNQTTVHERVECGLQYANAATPGAFADLGQPQMVSSFGSKEIVNLSFTGSRNLAAGTYNVRVVCSDMDYASSATHGWRFVSGNLTVMAARNA